jgi:CHAD domain-containing protein
MEPNVSQFETDSWKNQITGMYTRMIHYSAKALSFEDKEDLHQARVNNRKLISLLKAMRSDGQQQEMLTSLRKAHKLFGRIRDRDVLIESFKKRRKTLEDKSQRKLLKNFIQVQKEERKQHRKKLKKKLPDLLNKRIEKQWTSFMDSRFAEMIGEQQVVSYVSQLEEQFDHQRIHYEQWKQGQGMTHPNTLESLHKVRLLVKELRYLLSYADFADDVETLNKRQYYEGLQEPLGKINDRRVWLERWNELDAKELGASPEDFDRLIEDLTAELTKEIGLLQIVKPILN